MLKFKRNYKAIFEIGDRENLTVYKPVKEITVAYPFTCHLNIQSGLRSGQITSASFQFYNLSSTDQVDLWKDVWQQNKYIRMKFFAGYGTDLNLIYEGDILSCTSYRESGSTNYITDIKTDDGSLFAYYGVSNITINSNTEIPNILQTLLSDSSNYTVGYVTPTLKKSLRPKTYIGKTWELLNQEFQGYQVFINNGQLSIIKENEVVYNNTIPVITDASGLLGSPRRSDLIQVVELLFDPTIKIAGVVEVVSSSIPWLNGVYKVNGITHTGVISPVEGGTLITTVELLTQNAPFEQLKAVNQPPSNVNENSAPVQIPSTVKTSKKWIKPVKGSYSSYFGKRRQPTKGASTYHKGVDIAAPLNTSVVAPAAGKVISVGYDGASGRKIYINHGKINGVEVVSAYFHLNQYLVNAQQAVAQGQKIGLVGATGVATGPHLHFGVKENGHWVNPLKYIG